jgi:hypothetical protein
MMLLRPDFYFYPPQRQRAVIWLVGHTVYYIITRQNMMSLEDYVVSQKNKVENIQQEGREADIRELPYSNCMREGNRINQTLKLCKM